MNDTQRQPWARGVIAGVLGTAWLPSASARANIAPASEVVVEVRIGEGIAEADALRGWVEDEARSAISTLPQSVERRGTVHIGIEGNLYDYRVTLDSQQDHTSLGEPVHWTCECSNEELLDGLRVRVPPLAARLRLDDAEPEVIDPPPPVEPAVAPRPNPQADRRPRTGGAGVALITVGAASMATGLTLVGLSMVKTKAWANTSVPHPLAAGVLTGVGAGVLATGLALYQLRDRSRAPRRSAHLGPSIAPHRAGLVLTGRF